eukprot:scaffold9546_cov157-Skeletonema_menzelii.AAC.10
MPAREAILAKTAESSWHLTYQDASQCVDRAVCDDLPRRRCPLSHYNCEMTCISFQIYFSSNVQACQ